MKTIHLSLARNKKPMYQKIADSIRCAILNGFLKTEEQLPSLSTLASQFAVHRHTVMNAIHELITEGFVESNERKFYYVCKVIPNDFMKGIKKECTYTHAKKSTKDLFISQSMNDVSSYLLSETSNSSSFPSGYPDPRLFPMREFKSCLVDSLQSRRLLDYSNPCGHPRLIQELEKYLRRLRSIQGKEIIITHGSQEALFLLSQLFLKKGDKVAVELLGYPSAWSIFRFMGVELVPVKVDKQGLCVDDLQDKLKQHRIKLLYVTPLHQYPTTATLSLERRFRLYALAKKYRFLILEDDYDHEFHYTHQPLAPLAAYDETGIVLYVSTFSKIIFPSARIGFMAVSKEIAQNIIALKHLISRHNATHLQDAVGRFMSEGFFEKHLRKMRKVYQERCQVMVDILIEIKKQHPYLSFEVPSGGMALWLDIACSSYLFTWHAKKYGLYIKPEQSYRLDNNDGPHLRLGFSGQTKKEHQERLFQFKRALMSFKTKKGS